MPISKEQVLITIDKRHHQRYKVLNNASDRQQMAALRRLAHNQYLDAFNLTPRLGKYIVGKVFIYLKLNW